MNKTKILILATVFLDVVGIGIALPVLPIYLHDITQSEFLTSAFFSLYSFFGFLSAPILGAMSDRYGRKPILIGSLFGAVLGWIIFASGFSIWWLIAGRVIAGLASGNISAAQSALSDISQNKAERMQNFGLIGATFGVAFIVGPALGGLLAESSMTLPFWVTAVLCLLNAIAVVFFFPETHLSRDPHHPISFHPFASITKALKHPETKPLIIVFFLVMMSFTLVQSLLSLYTYLTYQFTPAQNGILMASVGIIIAINQGFFLKKVWMRFFNEWQMQVLFLGVLILTNLLIAVGNWWLFCLAMFLFPFAQSTLRVVLVNEITEITHEKGRGEVLGVTQSLMFLASILSPLFGGWVFEFGGAYPWLFGAVMMVAAFGVFMVSQKKEPEAV
ncbi:MAG: MFS transporter [Candidatus Peregrinibacteria bacterium]